MAEKPSDPSKVQDAQTPPTAANDNPTEEGLLSIENLEDIIKENDPEFSKGILEIESEQAALDLNIELLDLDLILEEEQARSLKARFRRLIKKIKLWIFVSAELLKNKTLLFFKETLPQGLKKGKTSISNFFEAINEGMRQFSYWPVKKKLITVSLIGATLLAFFYVYIASTRELLSPKTSLFLARLDDLADKTYIYEPATESEAFFDSSRSTQNMLAIQKLVVNLRRTASSGKNPMGAFEFYVEGNSPDVMVEIKDREYEVRDLFQRTIEEMTFESVDSFDGKQLLVEKLRREVNRILTKGRVRKVYIKTAIIKP